MTPAPAPPAGRYAPHAVAGAYIRATRGCPGRVPRFRGDNPDLAAFGAWCAARGVDPERYIRARHEAVGFAVRLRVRQLASDKFLASFREWGDGRQAEVQSQAAIGRTLERAGRASTLAERVRATTTDRDACRADPLTWRDDTSPTCAACPARHACGG